MHDTLANSVIFKYDKYSGEELLKIETLTNQYLEGEIEDIEQIDSLRMIREVFNLIKNKYKNKFQHIESLKRQMADNPEKFKQMVADQEKEAAAAEEEKPAEDAKEEEQPPAEGEEGQAPGTGQSARSK